MQTSAAHRLLVTPRIPDRLFQHLSRGRSLLSRTAPCRRATPSLTHMRAVQITRVGRPEVLEIVDVPEPTPGPGQRLYDVSTAGLHFAETHHGRGARHTA
jgi:hypothetical protein